MTAPESLPDRAPRTSVFGRHHLPSLPGLLMSTGLALLAGGLRLWVNELHPRGMAPVRR